MKRLIAVLLLTAVTSNQVMALSKTQEKPISTTAISSSFIVAEGGSDTLLQKHQAQRQEART